MGLAGERACVLCWAQAGAGKHLGASVEPNQGTCAAVWLCRGLATARLQCERRRNAGVQRSRLGCRLRA